MALPQLFDYVALIYSLLPRGAVWPSEPGDAPDFDGLIDAVSHEWARVHQAGEDFLDAFLPDTASTFLPDWERILGLSASGLTEEQRRAQIISQLRRKGDPNLPNIQTIADSWGNGAVVSVGDFPLFYMGVGAMGDALAGDAWASTVLITYDAPADAAFEAAMRAAVPIHTYVVFEVV